MRVSSTRVGTTARRRTLEALMSATIEERSFEKESTIIYVLLAGGKVIATNAAHEPRIVSRRHGRNDKGQAAIKSG